MKIDIIDMWINYGDAFFQFLLLMLKNLLKFQKKKEKKIIKIKKNVPIVLIGNKNDLNNEREIQFKDAKNLAKKWGIDYIETSAKNNFNCREALELIVRKYYNDHNEREKKKCCCCYVVFKFGFLIFLSCFLFMEVFILFFRNF